MKPIKEIAGILGLTEDDIELYGKYKAKISYATAKKYSSEKKGKLIIVTAINPTPFGEGKTTTSIGLGDALRKIGMNSIICLREPSLGPCMGVKGGAVGGGKSLIVPSSDINLHFTGDIHAVTTANNLLSSIIDNFIKYDLEPNIDIRHVPWKRCVDLNDRCLREVIVGLGGQTNGVVRDEGFVISVASEIMAILCLSDDLADLKTRLGRIVCAYGNDDKPITPKDLKCVGALAALMAEAIKPNLVQTIEGTPVFIHGGPFANIAHGTNSVIATRLALGLGDYIVQETGFGADLGCEKFLDIVAPSKGLPPDAVVIVASTRALKYNGGVSKKTVLEPNEQAIKLGFANLARHIENIKKFGITPQIAINRFPTDLDSELQLICSLCEQMGASAAIISNYEQGGQGAIGLAKNVVEGIKNNPPNYKPIYDYSLPIKEKITAVAKEIYRATKVNFTSRASSDIRRIEEMGYGNLPVCMAKTQYSFSDNEDLLGAPTGFEVTVREAKVSAGAGFVVAICGDIMLMPGLPKEPAAEHIDVDDNGVITGI